MFSIWENPKGEVYSLLIDYAMNKCSYFRITISEQMDLYNKGKIVLDKLKVSIIKSERKVFGVGQKQATSTYYYRCETNSALVLKSEANSLFSWVQPMLPEEFGQIISLKSLKIQGEKFKELPTSISNLKNIRYFNAENNPFVDVENEKHKLESITGLEEFDI